eukprot:CAMPEP_0185022942 /NCGR_PEP_ID=MMETSP1103-20130426/5653_1 /TAXON_ID=36769 /ORGANISM="Paraphysomonas bandaiensis, Strain Caron Lab Isolate" /LENGTH=164 /DNA_ID=CAMNT_0027555271 /DNA_START=567 /DNA_END=1061 /DNA_ORIENTATION=-
MIRYQYRIKGNDLVEECVVPYALKCFADFVGGSFCPIYVCVYGLFVAVSMQLSQEVNIREEAQEDTLERRYLAGYTPRISSTPTVVSVGAPGGVTIFNTIATQQPVGGVEMNSVSGGVPPRYCNSTNSAQYIRGEVVPSAVHYAPGDHSVSTVTGIPVENVKTL